MANLYTLLCLYPRSRLAATSTPKCEDPVFATKQSATNKPKPTRGSKAKNAGEAPSEADKMPVRAGETSFPVI